MESNTDMTPAVASRNETTRVAADRTESVTSQLRNPRFWALALSVTALAELILFWSPSYFVSVAAAVALPILLARHSAALVVFLVILAQEEISGPGVGFVTFLGDRGYYAGRVPLILIVAITAAVLAVVRLWRARVRDVSIVTWTLFAIVGALAVLSIVYGLIANQSLLSAVNQNARPFIACAVGIVIGLALRAVPAEQRAAGSASAAAFVGLAVMAALVISAGMSDDPRVSRYFTFSDSALPAAAAAVFLALLVQRGRRGWRRVLVMAACLFIVVIGFRRGVWLGLLVALAATVLLAPGRGRFLVRVAASAAAVTALLFVLPGLAVDVHDRLVGAPLHAGAPADSGAQTNPATGGSRGGSGDDSGDTAPSQQDFPPDLGGKTAGDSTEGHVSDINVGWRYVKQNFWTGVGPRARQLPELVADRSRLVYVHNEWLQDWLRYGPLAALLVTAFLGILALRALLALRRPDAGAVQLSAAMLAVITPVVLMLFPYVTTTTRWPLLLGVAAGILGLRDTVALPKVVGPHPPDGPSAG